MSDTRTYFLAWATNKRRGHCITEYAGGGSPVSVMSQMIEKVKEASNLTAEDAETLHATQFNKVD